ncbi:gp436 family protein [Chrysiogenes arsenatis]|uniref:gp436 family protein n=1 Tax=Chrysiogenes arsenatis TaxID=309797 RepID=UPI00042A1E58|nr:DUF1320 domain-containing protein [Chrysiogenes arsenatis]
MYATVADISAQYGEDLLYSLARDPEDPQLLDEPRIVRNLEAAAAEIDGYLTARNLLPIKQPYPPLLRRLNVDIAVQLLSGDRKTDERDDRYKAAVRILEAIAAGRMSLGIAAADEPAQRAEFQVATPPKRFDLRGF